VALCLDYLLVERFAGVVHNLLFPFVNDVFYDILKSNDIYLVKVIPLDSNRRREQPLEKGRWLIIITIMFALLLGCAGKEKKLTNKGSEAIVMNDYLGAERYLEEALALNPDNPYALFNMGVVYENTGRQQQAISMYQKVLELNTTQGKKASSEDQAIAERAGTNMRKLQIDIASSSRPIERPGLTKPEEPDLKDFFPALKKPEADEPPPGQAEGNTMAEGAVQTEAPTMAQDPALTESSAPLQPSDSPAPPPAATEVKKVEEPKAAPPPEPQKAEPPKKVYSIQVASYKNLDAAVKRIAELIDLGYDASYKKAMIKGEPWHRIFVDEFKSKEEAIKHAQSMKEKKVIKDFMIKVIE
jgi:cell division protein FtsN